MRACRQRRVGPAWLLIAALAAIAAGCGGSSKHHAHRTGTSSPTTTTTPGIRALATATDNANVFSGQQQMRVKIYDLRRSGPFVTLDFGVQCLQTGSVGCDATDFESNPNDTSQTPDGLALVDPAQNKEYLPVTDSQGQVYTSKLSDLSSTSPIELAWVKFAAPPAAVRRLEVLFPAGGPQISGIPLSTATTGPAPSQVGAGVTAPAPAPFSQPPESTSTTGLELPVHDLALAVGNTYGSDTEGGGRSMITISADVLFRFDKSNLTPKAQTILKSVGARVKSDARGPVTVDGYTDSIGTDAVNIPLSQARARSVVSALRPLTAGAPVSYRAQGFGSADPVAPNTKPNGADNPAGRALNRRVTITFRTMAPAKPKPPPAAPAAAAGGGSSPHSVVYKAVGSTGTSTYLVTASSATRDGDMVVLNFTAKCTASTGNGGCEGDTDFSGSTSVPPYPADPTGSLPSGALAYAGGVYLQDPTGAEYIPAYDAQNQRPVASQTPGANFGTRAISLWAYYPAPPPSVSSVTVVMPGGGAKIPNVPLAAQ